MHLFLLNAIAACEDIEWGHDWVGRDIYTI